MIQLPFQRISSEQYWDEIERVADSIRCVSPDTSENEAMLEETAPTPSVRRRPGRPRMHRTLDTLPDSAAVAAVEAIQRNQNAGCPPSYQNWLTPQYWPQIYRFLQRYNFHVRTAVRELKRRYPAIRGEPGLFDRLNESTVRQWFQKEHPRQLKSSVQQVLENWDLIQKCDESLPETVHEIDAIERLPQSLGSLGRRACGDVWTGREELEQEYSALIEALKSEGSILNSVTLQLMTRAFFQWKAPEVLRVNGGTFEASRSWIKLYLRQKMGWSFRCSTTGREKEPDGWKEKGRLMCLRMAFLIKAFAIPHELVVNMDQTLQTFLVGTNGICRCTGKLQPCDVILQRPLKCAFQREYAKWAIESISAQLKNGADVGLVAMDNMAFLPEVQKEALQMNVAGNLFNATGDDHAREPEPEPLQASLQEWNGEILPSQLMEEVLGESQIIRESIPPDFPTENSLHPPDFTQDVEHRERGTVNFGRYLSDITAASPYSG
ncbi:hypothetical protein R1sor_023268 [Riccia sorocarpa]|uniref:HTH CENPB-type domain-containing protein n=1 Tax=Riccia sorocarpa TaxID=122646 RepID=A0ABD3GM71_9MARC